MPSTKEILRRLKAADVALANASENVDQLWSHSLDEIDAPALILRTAKDLHKTCTEQQMVLYKLLAELTYGEAK